MLNLIKSMNMHEPHFVIYYKLNFYFWNYKINIFMQKFIYSLDIISSLYFIKLIQNWLDNILLDLYKLIQNWLDNTWQRQPHVNK